MHFKPTPLAAAVSAALAALLAFAPAAHAASFDWTSGNFVPGTTAPEPLPAGDVLNISTLATKTFNGIAFTNDGTVNWLASSGNLNFANAASVINNGLWSAQGDALLAYSGGAGASFVNNGTFRKSIGIGLSATNSSIGFTNNGVIDVQSGTFRVAGSGANSFNDGSSFIGTGVTELTASATFNGSFSSSNLRIAGGTSTGNAAIINGSVALNAGTLAGTWTVASGQSLVLDTGSTKALSGTVLTNTGTVTWTAASGNLNFANGATVVNDGVWNAQGDALLAYSGGADGLFVNNGTFRKSGGSGATATVSSMGFTNNGTIDVQSGTFRVSGSGANAFNAGTVFTGAGVAELDANATFTGAFDSGNLRITGGTSTGNAAVINGSVALNAGTLAGTWTVASGQTLVLDTASTKTLNGATGVLTPVLTNDGTVNWLAGSGNLNFANGARVVNNGLWNAQGDALLAYSGGAGASFVNNGTFRKSIGIGLSATNSSIGFTNNGVIDVQSGTFRVAGSGANSFNDGSSFIGTGVTELTASATFNGSFSSSNLRIAGGTSTGNAAIINGSVALNAGTLAGTWTVASGQSLVLDTASTKTLNGPTNVITNKGTVRWATGSGNLNFANGATVVNDGVWNAQGDALLAYSGGADGLFVNNGTFRKSGGSGATATVSSMGFTNNGTIDVQSGTFRVSGSGANAFNAGTVFTGAGVAELDANATFTGAFDSGNLRITGGTSTGNAAVINGSVALNAGTLAGTWTVASGQTLVLDTASTKTLNGATNVLTNNGTVRWTAASGNLNFANGATVVNDGVWDAQGNALLAYSGGAAATFVNNGVLRKSGGSGTTGFISSIGLVNNGTVDVQSGNFMLPTAFVNAGKLTGDGRFTTAGGLTNNGTVAPGSFGAGTLSMTGAYTQTAAGTLALDLTSLASFDLLDITGAANLAGTLALNCLGACSFDIGDSFTVLTSTAARSGSFAGLTLNGFASGAFDVLYSSNSVQLLVTQTVSAVPEPETYALWLAGLAMVVTIGRRRARA